MNAMSKLDRRLERGKLWYFKAAWPIQLVSGLHADD